MPDNASMPGVRVGWYRVRPPLVKKSRIAGGWVVNYAVGCTHGCVFCYADSIHKKYNVYGLDVGGDWGTYFYIPRNLWQAIVETPWGRWRGKEVLLSSMHDPYLPQLYKYTRAILERALRAGVRVRILTRSPLVLRDLDLLEEYRDKVTVGVSIATLDPGFARLIELRVTPPRVRLRVLEEAAGRGLRTVAHVAPVFPANRARPWLEEDLESIMAELARVGVDYVYGESLHARGSNMAYIRRVLGEEVRVDRGFDGYLERLFHRLLGRYGLRGEYLRGG
ncbi:MAG: radical SAM protein [Desulfurococcales archaeon]|nr:radical SAM protein [Desulfurococcales archaeon]